MSSLNEKFKFLGVRNHLNEVSIPAKFPNISLNNVMEGQYHQNEFGVYFRVDKFYPFHYYQGVIDLNPSPCFHLISDWLRDGRWLDIHQNEVIFIDIETSGITHSAGTFAFLIGLGVFEGDQFHVIQIFMDDPSQEKAFLFVVSLLSESHQGIISFNGKSFDIPLLCSRHTFNGVPTFLGRKPHLDLLPLARKFWKDCLPSKSLKSLETHILRFNRSIEDVPSWYIPELYREYLITKDARLLKSIFYHNEMDVLSMSALFCYLSRIMIDPINYQPKCILDITSLADFYECLKDFDTAAQIFSCNLSYVSNEKQVNNILKWSFLEKKRRNYAKAVELWNLAAQLGNVHAMIELAKYYEHYVKEYKEAMRWVEFAFESIDKSGYPSFARKDFILSLHHRYDRLKEKLSKTLRKF